MLSYVYPESTVDRLDGWPRDSVFHEAGGKKNVNPHLHTALLSEMHLALKESKARICNQGLLEIFNIFLSKKKKKHTISCFPT